jgi:hypothetical protein
VFLGARWTKGERKGFAAKSVESAEAGNEDAWIFSAFFEGEKRRSGEVCGESACWRAFVERW